MIHDNGNTTALDWSCLPEVVMGRRLIAPMISHYRLVGALGGGTTVFHALDTRDGREVALKFVSDDHTRDASAFERFRRAVHAVSTLKHPNIRLIFDVGLHDGRAYLVMELLRGQSLRTVIAGQAMATERLLRAAKQMADALDVAHRAQIVHRDIKPANLFITDDGDAKILDFGLAELQGDPAQAVTGSAVGTMAYMSPEQTRGEALDGRSDIFSLGLVIYEMATGHQAFSGTTSAEIFRMILHDTPVAPVRLNPEVPAALEKLIDRALQKDPRRRYPSAADLGADLARLKSA
jgi:serine/threonine protein kinase